MLRQTPASRRHQDSPNRSGLGLDTLRQTMEESSPEPGWLRQLWTLLRPHRRNVAIAMGAAALGQVVAAIIPLIQRVVIDRVIIAGTAPLLPGVLALFGAAAVSFGAAYVRRYWAGRVSLDVQNDLRTQVYDHLQRLDIGQTDQMATGQLVSRSISDIGLVQGLLAFLPLVLANGLFLLVAVGAMLWLSPLLTVVALAVTPLLLITSLRMRTQVFPASWDAQQQAGAVAGVVDESVTGVRVVKGFGQERQEVARMGAAAERLYGSRLRALRLQARYQPLMQTLPALAQVAVLALGGWLAIEGRISLGTFLAFSSYVGQLQAPTRMLAGLVTIGQQARAGVERVFELLSSTAAVRSAPDAPDLVVPQGQVVFDDVTFGYLRSEPVLNHFDLRIEPGETMALVGTSGSGKSTVALLLPRFYDVASGSIRIDDTNIKTVGVESLRRSLGLVFEDSFLFSDTLAANIAYGRPDATREEIEVAAKVADAHRFIDALEQGYDTPVGERGLTLSGGQRQRIALARAVLSDPKILVLDDATSAVDSRVEAEIHATLHKVLAGRTTLLIAHRRSTLLLADRIAVLDAGRVHDVGTHDELIERCDLYRRLLTGPGEDLLEELDDSADSDPSLAVVDGITPALWNQQQDTDQAAEAALVAAGRRSAVPSLGTGGGGGGGGRGGGGGWSDGLAATPELLAKVAALPAVKDRPDTTVESEQERHTEATRSGDQEAFRFSRFVARWRWQLAAGLALVVADGLTTLAGPLLIRHGLDAGVTPGVIGAVWSASLLFLAIVAVGLVVMVAETLLTGRVAERILFALRVRVFSHLQRLGMDYYDREMGGKIMTRMTSDIEALTQLLQTGLVNAIVAVITGVGVGIALGIMNWRLALLSLTVVPPLAIATTWFRRRSSAAYNEARDRVATVNADFQESLSDVRVAQAYVREDVNAARFARRAGRYLDARLRAQRLVAIYFPFVQFLSGVAGALVIAGGATMVRDGSLSSGELIAFLLYLDLFFGPIQQLSQVFDTYQQARVSVGRIGELLDEPSSTPDAKNPIEPGPLTGRIEFRDVGFAYPHTNRVVLDGLDLVIEAGKTVAIVGETGAGKSTLEKLVARYYDVTSGQVLVDGHDLRDLRLDSYRHQLGVVPQEPFLFAGTIRDNIAFGRSDATDAEVEAVARATGAHDLIATLPGGYMHVVGEGGRSLSSGQRQLLALARALLVDPVILLLDEATANLDLATEAEVSRAMAVASRGRTTLVIAHRLTTAVAADEVIVVANKRVVEQGTHQELLAAEGPYFNLWASFTGQAAVA